ncbi:MAG: DUF2188 domain-containing protein [Candidatus Doudnabacteria bacterium]|nr:DUF2188 domain-containing protein [Candidatus Doudnabacteria bacterium]
MERPKYHVSPTQGGDWRVKRVGAQRAGNIVENKLDAIARAKELAKGNELGQVIVHGKDRKIQTEYAYGKDPEKYKS